MSSLRPIQLVLVSVLAVGCGIDVHNLEGEQPLAESDASFVAGEATVDDVLARLGPPAQVGAFADGHWFHYQHVEQGEYGFVMRPLLLGKVGIFGASGDARSLVVVFDENDRLSHAAFGVRPLGSGLGGALGHVRTRFDPFSLGETPMPSRTAWAAGLLSPVPHGPASQPAK